MAEKDKLDASMETEKIKKFGATKKTWYSMLSIGACLGLIIVISVVQVIFNPNVIYDTQFWINFIILAAISIFSMITGQGIGDDSGRNNQQGQFRKSLGRFGAIFDKIEIKKWFAYFADWLENYRERKLRKKIESTLKDEGVYQMEVLDLDQSELECLIKPYKKDWKNTIHEGKYKEDTTYFLSYSTEQIDIIRYCLQGKVKVSRLPESFFLSALNQSTLDMWESAAHSKKKKNSYVKASYLYRLLGMLAISVLFSGMQPIEEGAGSGGSVAVALFTRIFTMIVSVVWGIFIGYELVKIDIMYIDFKSDILTQYYNEWDNGMYVHETLEEKARKAYEEQAKLLEKDNVAEERVDEYEQENVLD